MRCALVCDWMERFTVGVSDIGKALPGYRSSASTRPPSCLDKDIYVAYFRVNRTSGLLAGRGVLLHWFSHPHTRGLIRVRMESAITGNKPWHSGLAKFDQGMNLLNDNRDCWGTHGTLPTSSLKSAQLDMEVVLSLVFLSFFLFC